MKDVPKAIEAVWKIESTRLIAATKEFIRDLGDIEAIADWAEEEGAERMTLEVNW
jgi:hypothetical protein